MTIQPSGILQYPPCNKMPCSALTLHRIAQEDELPNRTDETVSMTSVGHHGLTSGYYDIVLEEAEYAATKVPNNGKGSGMKWKKKGAALEFGIGI